MISHEMPGWFMSSSFEDKDELFAGSRGMAAHGGTEYLGWLRRKVIAMRGRLDSTVVVT